MKSIVRFSIFFTLIILGTITFFIAGTVKGNEISKTILIDPGHGGFDGGAISKNGTVEKDINLSIALKLRECLKQYGFKVVMTREIDKDLCSVNCKHGHKKKEDLSNRCKFKKESNCDIFISIHQNMFPESYCKGSQIWYSRNDESKNIAIILQNKLKEKVDNSNSRIAKPAKDDYKVLRCDNIPSILVECGFLSNPIDEKNLKSDDYQQKIALALSEGVKDYIQNNKG